jgi:predicted RNA-binding Zn-ribbon protein involved in translation (DUF1610 family)
MSTKRRAFAGVCDACGRDIERVIEVAEGQVSQHGVLMRCAECREVSLIPARSTGDHRADPAWLVSPDDVLEWFRCGNGEVRADD